MDSVLTVIGTEDDSAQEHACWLRSAAQKAFSVITGAVVGETDTGLEQEEDHYAALAAVDAVGQVVHTPIESLRVS